MTLNINSETTTTKTNTLSTLLYLKEFEIKKLNDCLKFLNNVPIYIYI